LVVVLLFVVRVAVAILILFPRPQTVVVVGDARRLEAQLKALPGRTLERLPLRPES
jgi:hypothetical protein